MRDRLGKFLTQNPGVLKRPVIIRSHGGRARAIESGEVHIDVAFMGAPTADPRGNATGRMGKSACGALGYAKVDSHYADTTVIITDNLGDYVHNYAIPQTDVDYVVEVESIGDPEGIASGAVGFTKNPIQIKIAELAGEFLDQAGIIKDGFVFQLGAGGAPLTVAKFIAEKLRKRGEVGGFAIGGATGILTGMLEEGLIRAIYDTQTFDTTAAASLDKNSAHIEMSASMYANPWTDCSDTAAGAKCTVITCPLIRGRLPMIRDKVATVITPGSSVDVLVTEYGIAINPARTDLIERFKDSNLPIFTIEELQQLAFDLVGKPQDIPVSDKDEDIIAIVEYRDGSIIDVVRKPL